MTEQQTQQVCVTEDARCGDAVQCQLPGGGCASLRMPCDVLKGDLMPFDGVSVREWSDEERAAHAELLKAIFS